jgi:hypothetical protein
LTALWHSLISLPALPFLGFRFGLLNQTVRAPLDFIEKRLHNFVARLFAFERVSVDPYLQFVFACVVLVFYFGFFDIVSPVSATIKRALWLP